MICSIEGVLDKLEGQTAQVRLAGGLTYAVLVPSFQAVRLSVQVGKPVRFYTHQYIEGGSGGGPFIPRLIGFGSELDRSFFELFTQVKGIGPRKALRAMAVSTAQIAGAIAARDLKTLQALPEIGRRTAETMVAELNGKVDRFLSQVPAGTGAAEGPASPVSSPVRAAAAEAIEVLVQLGENRAVALQWIDEIQRHRPELSGTQELLTEVFRRRGTPS